MVGSVGLGEEGEGRRKGLGQDAGSAVERGRALGGVWLCPRPGCIQKTGEVRMRPAVEEDECSKRRHGPRSQGSRVL